MPGQRKLVRIKASSKGRVDWPVSLDMEAFMSGRASRDREQGRDARGKDRRIERKYGRKPTG